MSDEHKSETRRQRRPTLVFPPSVTPETFKAGLERIGGEQFEAAWKAFCALTEMMELASASLGKALDDHTGDGAGVVPWTPVIDASIHLISADRFTDDLYFGFWSAFIPPNEEEEEEGMEEGKT